LPNRTRQRLARFFLCSCIRTNHNQKHQQASHAPFRQHQAMHSRKPTPTAVISATMPSLRAKRSNLFHSTPTLRCGGSANFVSLSLHKIRPTADHISKSKGKPLHLPHRTTNSSTTITPVGRHVNNRRRAKRAYGSRGRPTCLPT